MATQLLCAKLRERLTRLFRDAFGKDLDTIMKARGHELWLLGLDSRNALYIDICGSIGSSDLKKIQDRGFFNTDAGYQTSAHAKLGIDRKFDAFLLNVDYFALDEMTDDPLIVHELAHLLEQLKKTPGLEASDDENSDAILNSLEETVRRVHTKEWAQHLAVGARVLVAKKLTPHTTIQSFLEAAIPEYDREGRVETTEG